MLTKEGCMGMGMEACAGACGGKLENLTPSLALLVPEDVPYLSLPDGDGCDVTGDICIGMVTPSQLKRPAVADSPCLAPRGNNESIDVSGDAFSPRSLNPPARRIPSFATYSFSLAVAVRSTSAAPLAAASLTAGNPPGVRTRSPPYAPSQETTHR